MKRISKKAYQFYFTFLSLLLGLMGVASCIDHMARFYGTPTANYLLKGKVTSEKTNLPLDKIKVVMLYDSVLTDSQGYYEIKFDSQWSAGFNLTFSDQNNSDGLEYLTVDTLISFEGEKFIGGDDEWYSGEATKTLNIKMKLAE